MIPSNGPLSLKMLCRTFHEVSQPCVCRRCCAQSSTGLKASLLAESTP